jgi:putative nucleotidyltransferase with HDIG domain
MPGITQAEPTVLFIDDESKVLDGLRRMLRPLRHEWRMMFAEGAPEALRLLAANSFDVVVTEMQMLGLSGSALLAKVAKECPQTVRIALSGMREHDLLLAAGAAHRILKKPCVPEELYSALKMALALRHFPFDPALREFIVRINSLPSVPSVYFELLDASRDPDISLDRLSRIISRDLAMSGKMLQIANSPLFSMSRTLRTPREACIYVGIDNIKALVLSVSVFSQFEAMMLPNFSVESLQDHCLRTATLARKIAGSEGLGKTSVDECFLAGLFHDVGKLIFATNSPVAYESCLASAARGETSLLGAETGAFGLNHAEAGMYLLRFWGLSETVIEAVGLHHRCPGSRLGRVDVGVAVYAANIIVHEDEHELPSPSFEIDGLKSVACSEKVGYWRELNREIGMANIV